MKTTVIIVAVIKMQVFSGQKTTSIFFLYKVIHITISLVDMMLFLKEKEITASVFLGHFVFLFLQLILFIPVSIALSFFYNFY